MTCPYCDGELCFCGYYICPNCKVAMTDLELAIALLERFNGLEKEYTYGGLKYSRVGGAARMSHTKGAWKATETAEVCREEDECRIALVYDPYDGRWGTDTARANAYMIAAAVNGCQAVNPDNPLAVAESIKDMYEALQYLRGVFRDAKVQVLAEALPDQVAVESAFERVDAALAKVNWRSLG